MEINLKPIWSYFQTDLFPKLPTKTKYITPTIYLLPFILLFFIILFAQTLSFILQNTHLKLFSSYVSGLKLLLFFMDTSQKQSIWDILHIFVLLFYSLYTPLWTLGHFCLIRASFCMHILVLVVLWYVILCIIAISYHLIWYLLVHMLLKLSWACFYQFFKQIYVKSRKGHLDLA